MVIVVVMMVITTAHSNHNLPTSRCGQRNQEQQSGEAQQNFLHDILHFMRCPLQLADIGYRTQLFAPEKRCLSTEILAKTHRHSASIGNPFLTFWK